MYDDDDDDVYCMSMYNDDDDDKRNKQMKQPLILILQNSCSRDIQPLRFQAKHDMCLRHPVNAYQLPLLWLPKTKARQDMSLRPILLTSSSVAHTPPRTVRVGAAGERFTFRALPIWRSSSLLASAAPHEWPAASFCARPFHPFFAM